MQELRAPRKTTGLAGGAAENLRKARTLDKRGEPEAAAVLLRALLARFPGNRQAQEALAEIEARPPLLPQGETPEERETVRLLVAAVEASRHAEMVRLGESLVQRYRNAALLHNILGVGHSGLGDHDLAIAHYRRALQLRPVYPEAAFNMGVALQATERRREAIEAYGFVLRHEPERADAYNNIGAVLQEAGDYDAAIAAFTAAIALDPDVHSFYNNRGIAKKSAGRFEASILDFEKALRLKPDAVEIYDNIAHSLKSTGRIESAKTCLWRALDVSPGHPTPIASLASMVRGEEAERLRALAAPMLAACPPGSRDRMRAHYAMANLAFARGEAAEAMDHLEQAGRIGKALAKFDFADEETLFRRITAQFAPGPEPLAPGAPAAPMPVFILGMPRSGTSLVEEMLSSHSRVHGAGELESLRRAVLASGGNDGPLTAEKLGALRQHYLDELGRLVREERPVVTDKMPTNFRFLGHIAAALPEAKIVHMRRTPEAVCWSNYKLYFPARGIAYSFDQRDTARMHRLHDAYMAFWHARFPGRIVEVDYEALTEDPEAGARRLLAALGLDWEDAVLSFHEKDRSVRTASATQVRQEIYRGSSEKWRAYAPWLGPMLEELAAYRPPAAPALD